MACDLPAKPTGHLSDNEARGVGTPLAAAKSGADETEGA
jgi:hypothetical protein